MRLLTSAYTLDTSGVPTYTVALSDGLRRLGHDVAVYSPHGGRLADRVRHTTDPREFARPDLILAQHRECAETLSATFPETPLMFLAHGIKPDGEQPPDCRVDHYVSVYEALTAHLAWHGIDRARISLVRDFVDTSVFRLKRPLDTVPRRALYISNAAKRRAYGVVSEACALAGFDLRCVGAPYGRSLAVEEDINRASVVISWGRGIIEAMACGRGVVSFDRGEGDGYLDHATYMRSRRRNFAYGPKMDAKALADALMKHADEYGGLNRVSALAHHDSRTGVAALLAIAKEKCGVGE